MERGLFHSVTLNLDKCKGCTTCIKHCPTEAIRVRFGKAYIIEDRCIDCGQCIRVCPHRAKSAVCDSFEALKNYRCTVALPAPSLYGQFNNLTDIGLVLTGLLKIGFDRVYEVAAAAEYLSDFTRSELLKNRKLPHPTISSACPTCVRLIKHRFPELAGHVLPYAAPVELAAILARDQAVAETGLAPEEIGVFFISPCPAKVTASRLPVGGGVRVMDGVLSMTDVYTRLLPVLKGIEEPEVTPQAGLTGIGWSVSGGEGSALLNGRYLAVDGIENVIKILEDLEDEKLPDLDFIELNACTQGCVGGCLAVENPYVAKTRIRGLMKYLPVSRNKASAVEGMADGIRWKGSLESESQWALDTDMGAAMEKLLRINELANSLPGLDCGSCGAPTCRALAEDVVLGHASEEDCIFRMRERMQILSGGGEADADAYLPPPFRKCEEDRK